MYLHSVPLRFFSKRCHALDVGDARLPPIEDCSCDVDELPSDVRGVWFLRRLYDSVEHLINLVFVNRFEVSVVLCPQDGVGYVFSNNLGDSLYDPLLDADFCEAEDFLSVGFFLGVAVSCDFWFDCAGVGADDIGRRS